MGVLAQAATLLLLWIAVFVGSGVDFLRLGEKLSNTALRPSWMPKSWFLLLLRSSIYRPAAYSIVPYMFLQAFVVEKRLLILPVVVALSRSLVALAVTIFHLGDSSRTSSHRDYLMLYNCWVLALCGWINAFVFPAGVDEVAHALALGFCIWYIFSCGVSKVVLAGGVSVNDHCMPRLMQGFREWSFGDTLNAILETFSRKTPKGGGPVREHMTVFKTDIHSRTETRRLAAIPIVCASINWFVQHLRKTVFFWERRTVEDRFHQVQNNLHDWWDWKSVGRDFSHHGGAAKGKPDHKARQERLEREMKRRLQAEMAGGLQHFAREVGPIAEQEDYELSVNSQERFSLTVRTSSTILQIKHNIADLYGMAVESQRLHLTPEPEEFSQRGGAFDSLARHALAKYLFDKLRHCAVECELFTVAAQVQPPHGTGTGGRTDRYLVYHWHTSMLARVRGAFRPHSPGRP
ncbi:unnamed protein product [Symbiodinium necroappetens]|uniref:Uncharacterized protein n=1 Tax=Symbiodinium necroappetens TaxID=1628268 RepID=A0A812LCG2_9DINO|nr:unnamed protein product [Symbiodinium necroappetens]